MSILSPLQNTSGKFKVHMYDMRGTKALNIINSKVNYCREYQIIPLSTFKGLYETEE